MDVTAGDANFTTLNTERAPKSYFVLRVNTGLAFLQIPRYCTLVCLPGSGVAHGKPLGEIGMRQIAPALAQILPLDFPDAEEESLNVDWRRAVYGAGRCSPALGASVGFVVNFSHAI